MMARKITYLTDVLLITCVVQNGLADKIVQAASKSGSQGVTQEAGVGTRTTLNILDAEKELTQAEADLINARFQLLTASYDLLKTCGLINLEYLVGK